MKNLRPYKTFSPAKTAASWPAFSLIEVLIASSIFVVVGLIALTVFVNILRIQQRISLENAIYEDARFMMERMAREIRLNTIDYEEYYTKLVEENVYGGSYGCYASRFYNPGDGGPQSGGLGTFCNDGVTDANTNPTCIISKSSQDINTGKNPYEGNFFLTTGDMEDANAFCDANYGPTNQCSNPNQTFYLQDELYLIDSKGTQKTLMARKVIANTPAPEYALALVRLKGEDSNTDGITERWTECSNQALCCASDFDCEQPVGPNGETTLESTLLYNANTNYKGFVPVSPSRTTITSLQFYIAPLDDPRKAFAESTSQTQQQPHVTIILSVQPSHSVLQNYNGEIPTLTLQTTITSRVYNEVKSYYGAEKPDGSDICVKGYAS